MPEGVQEPLVERFVFDRLIARVKKLAMNMQFAWFVGHLVTVTQAVLTIFSSGNWNYYKAYYGTLLSYGIILWKAHKVLTPVLPSRHSNSTFNLHLDYSKTKTFNTFCYLLFGSLPSLFAVNLF